MSRVYNFSAGPSMLPEEVLKQAQAEFLDYNGSGMSVCEMSHRSKVFESILEKAKSDLKELMNIPDNYKILFLKGDATDQYAAIPMNLLSAHRCADYIVSGDKDLTDLGCYQQTKILKLAEFKEIFSFS